MGHVGGQHQGNQPSDLRPNGLKILDPWMMYITVMVAGVTIEEGGNFLLVRRECSRPQTLVKEKNVVVQMDGNKKPYLRIMHFSETHLNIPIGEMDRLLSVVERRQASSFCAGGMYL